MNLWQKLKETFSSPTYVAVEPADWLVIGLGNPGKQYDGTRHNVGYMAVDALLGEVGGTLQPVKGIPAAIANVRIAGKQVVVVRSTTFMNESGQAVAPLCSALNIPADHVIVIHDELDLPVGKVRIKRGGNENGHNGLKSVTAELGTWDYLRVRMGISRPPQDTPVVRYVLSELPLDEAAHRMVESAAQAVTLTIGEGISAAQNQIHSR